MRVNVEKLTDQTSAWLYIEYQYQCDVSTVALIVVFSASVQ